MTRYHVNDEGNPGKCRAKTGNCPFGGTDDHYDTQQEAATAYEKSQAEKKFAPLSRHKPHKATDQALTSDLTYSGPKPRWMKGHEKISQKLFGTTPEIIDTLDTPAGPALVIWNQNSTANNDVYNQTDSGYEVSSIEYRHMKTGEKLGYLKFAYVTDTSYKRSFGDDEFSDLKNYQDNNGKLYAFDTEMIKPGKNGDGKDLVHSKMKSPYSEESSDEDRLAAKRELWAKAHKGMSIEPKGFDRNQFNYGGLLNLKPDHAPDNEKEIDEDMKKINKVAKKESEKFKRSHEVPYIDFARVEEKIKGHGLGVSLYVYSARMLAKQDKTLCASSNQTDDAKAAWKRMGEDKRLPIKEIQTTYERDESSFTKNHLALDFRD